MKKVGMVLKLVLSMSGYAFILAGVLSYVNVFTWSEYGIRVGRSNAIQLVNDPVSAGAFLILWLLLTGIDLLISTQWFKAWYKRNMWKFWSGFVIVIIAIAIGIQQLIVYMNGGPVINASYNGDLETIQQAYTDKKVTPEMQTKMLNNAAQRGYGDIVSYLLSQGANPNQTRDDGLPVLHIATWWGTTGTIKALIDGGADINVISPENGYSILMIIVSRTDTIWDTSTKKEMISYALEHGANKDLVNKQGKTALQLAELIEKDLVPLLQ